MLWETISHAFVDIRNIIYYLGCFSSMTSLSCFICFAGAFIIWQRDQSLDQGRAARGRPGATSGKLMKTYLAIKKFLN